MVRDRDGGWVAALAGSGGASALLVYFAELPQMTLDFAAKLSGIGSLIVGIVGLVVAAVGLKLAVRQDFRVAATNSEKITCVPRPPTVKFAEIVPAAWVPEVDLYKLGDFEAARRLDEETLLRCRQILGPDHPDTLLLCSNLAVDLRALGKRPHAALRFPSRGCW